MIHAVTCVSFLHPCLLLPGSETLKAACSRPGRILLQLLQDSLGTSPGSPSDVHYLLSPKKRKYSFFCSKLSCGNYSISERLYAPAVRNYLNNHNRKGPGLGVESLVAGV